jgi:hypothetical protein
MLSTAACIWAMVAVRISESKVRRVPPIIMSSGMMLWRTPLWMTATVITVGERATSSLREAIWLKAWTISALREARSIPSQGLAPWVCLPLMRIS